MSVVEARPERVWTRRPGATQTGRLGRYLSRAFPVGRRLTLLA